MDVLSAGVNMLSAVLPAVRGGGGRWRLGCLGVVLVGQRYRRKENESKDSGRPCFDRCVGHMPSSP
jgi:hypothetical protein